MVSTTGIDTGTAVPAGWYPDPQGPPLQRWWDGTSWTPHTNDPRPPLPVPVPVAVPVPMPAPARVPMPFDDIAPAYVPMQGFEATRAVSHSTSEPPFGVLRASPLNAWIWLLAAMPAIQGVVGIIVLVALKDLPGGVVRYAVLIGPIVAHIYLARRDGAALRESGYVSTAWGWILLPLVYFILRTVRVGREAIWPLLAWVVLQVLLLVVAAAVLVPVLLSVQDRLRSENGPGSTGDSEAQTAAPLTPAQRDYQLTEVGMSERLLADLQNGGMDVTSVDCEPASSFAEGTEVACATDLDGASTVLVVTIQPADPYVPFYLTGVRQ